MKHRTIEPELSFPLLSPAVILAPMIRRTVADLAAKKFRVDPIVGERVSRSTSIASSAFRRHGQVLEQGFFERLKQQVDAHFGRDVRASIEDVNRAFAAQLAPIL